MTKPAPAIHALASAALADRGVEALRLGRFKEAIEAFKQLIRRDPRPDWRERLSDAYVGRARALADKGMFKEAAMVLENTLAPDGTVREPALYIGCLVRQGQLQKAAQIAPKYVGTDRRSADVSSVAEIAGALCLVAPAASAASPEWTKLSRATHAALGAWVEGKPLCDVEPLLTHIPLHSPLGPLRVIMTCLLMPQDAAMKAIDRLHRIPDESVFSGLGAATEAVLMSDASALLERWCDLSRDQQKFVTEIRGLPPAATERLSQILRAERAGPAALFALLVKPGFPVPTDTLRTACLDLLPVVPGCTQQFERRFGPLSGLERHRALALAAEKSDRWLQALQHWDAVLAGLSGPPGSEAGLARGVILRHLADLARRHPEVGVEPGLDPIAHYLECSLAADPDHLPATLSLIEHYRQSDDIQAWHRLAERAAGRFPESTAILLHAVDAAVVRNAYKKAAGFARHLLQLDPINHSVRQRLIELQLARARKQMRASRVDLATRTLSQAAEWERGDAPNAWLRVAQALASYEHQNSPSDVRLQQAVALAGGGTVGWFRAVLEAAMMGWTDQRRQPLHRELAAAQTGEPSRESILSLIVVLTQREIRESKRIITSILWRIDRWLLRGATLGWSEPEFETIAACLYDLDAFDTLGAYAREAMRRDPNGTAAGFYRMVAQTKGKSGRLSEAQAMRLFELLDDTGARLDVQLASRIRGFLADRAAAHSATRMGGLADGLGPLDIAEILDQAGTELPKKDLRRMVNEFGRDRTIELLAGMMGDSPLGEVLTDEQLALLCGMLVMRAVAGQRRAAHR